MVPPFTEVLIPCDCMVQGRAASSLLLAVVIRKCSGSVAEKGPAPSKLLMFILVGRLVTVAMVPLFYELSPWPPPTPFMLFWNKRFFWSLVSPMLFAKSS